MTIFNLSTAIAFVSALGLMISPFQSKASPPDEPAVVDDIAEPGKQGGEMVSLVGRAKDVRLFYVYGHARLVNYTQELELYPDILKDIEVEEGRVFTLHLRPGHRWSDGTPFTAEDFRFYWEEIATDPELKPLGPPIELVTNEHLPEFEVIDSHTVRYTWPEPNPFFLPRLAAASPLFIYVPAHYLKAFHKNYVEPEALQQLVEEDEARDWVQLFYRRERMNKFDNPDLPTLQPWMLTTRPPSERFVGERNPYFHRVDGNGVQLPYIDRFILQVADQKLVALKASAGETDLQSRGLSFKDYTFLKKNADKAGIQINLWPEGRASRLAIYPNLNANDDTWRELFRSQDFRRALSIAINRESINKYLYFGLAKPANNTLLPESPLYREEFGSHCTEFNLDEANSILDGLGLTERGPDGIRKLPDGRPFELIVETAGEDSEQVDLLELIADDWEKIGFKIHSKPSEREVLRNRVFAGEALMMVWFGLENGVPSANMPPTQYVPVSQYDQIQWSKWGQYYETKGNAGEAPDLPDAVRLMELFGDWKSATDTQAKQAAWDEILDIYSRNCFSIGTTSSNFQPIVSDARLRNVPEKGVYNWEPYAQLGLYRPDTFWFADN